MIGMTSISGSLDMMTPAACTPHWRFRPSSPSAVSTTSWQRRVSSCDQVAELAALAVALGRSGSKMPASGMSLPMTAGGIALVSCSPIANG